MPQGTAVRIPLALAVLAGVAVTGVVLYLAWPLGVLLGTVGAALATVVIGLRMQRQWEAAGAPAEALERPAESSPDAVRRAVAQPAEEAAQAA